MIRRIVDRDLKWSQVRSRSLVQSARTIFSLISIFISFYLILFLFTHGIYNSALSRDLPGCLIIFISIIFIFVSLLFDLPCLFPILFFFPVAY